MREWESKREILVLQVHPHTCVHGINHLFVCVFFTSGFFGFRHPLQTHLPIAGIFNLCKFTCGGVTDLCKLCLEGICESSTLVLSTFLIIPFNHLKSSNNFVQIYFTYIRDRQKKAWGSTTNQSIYILEQEHLLCECLVNTYISAIIKAVHTKFGMKVPVYHTQIEFIQCLGYPCKSIS